MAFQRLSKMIEAIKSGSLAISWVRMRTRIEYALEDGCITSNEHAILLDSIGR